jgi:hypothetical protein
MSQTLNSIPTFDGTNYGYWEARKHFLLKSINVWHIVEYMLVFVLAAFCWTKSLLCNVAAFTGMPYISESSDIQSLFL